MFWNTSIMYMNFHSIIAFEELKAWCRSNYIWFVSINFSLYSTRVSNELGAGHPQAASLAVRVALFLVLADGIMMVLVMILLRKIWGNLYSSDTHVIKYVAAVMPILATCSFLDGIQSVLSGIRVNFRISYATPLYVFVCKSSFPFHEKVS